MLRVNYSKRKKSAVNLLLVALLALGGGYTAQAQEVAEIRVGHHLTAPGTPLVVSLDINCSDVAGCGAFAIEILFDPTVVQIEQVELGPYLGESAFEAENSVDNETGSIKLAAAALGQVEAASSGDLAYLHLKGLQQGVSPLLISVVEIGDLQGLPVSAIAVDGSITVLEEGPLQAQVDLPEAVRFLCHAQPLRKAEGIQYVPGGAEITILGRLAQEAENGAENTVKWLLIEATDESEQTGPCWATTQTLRVVFGEQRIALDDIWDILPAIPAKDTDTEPEQVQESDDVLPCVVRAERRGVAVRVGPGLNRAVRSALLVSEDVAVLGWFEDDTGSRWWKIQPDDWSEAEADRYWVAESDVVTVGGCNGVAEAEPSRFVYTPPTAVPTSIPPAPPIGAPQGAVNQPAGAPPDPAQPEPGQPEPVCYTISLVVHNEGTGSGGGSLSPEPNCAGGRYLAGTQITVHVWGDVDAIYGDCGVGHDWFEEPTAGPFTASRDCTVIFNILT